MKSGRVLVLCGLLLAAPVVAAEMGSMVRGEELKAEPFRDAKSVKQLAVGDKVQITGKDGGWFKVKAGKSSGWVRMLSVRKGEAKSGVSAASSLLALASGRTATGKVMASTGVRGLNEEELKAAAFNAQELQRAESYAAGKADAQQFAAQGKLVARQFDYLPAAK